MKAGITIFAISAALTMALPAATRTWTDGGDGTTWTDPANWGGMVPADGDTATFSVADTLTCGSNIEFSGNITIKVSSGTVILAGVVSGSGGITKSGSGTLYLANRANTYDGLMTVSAGALYCRSFAAVTLNGGSLRLYGSGMFETDQPIRQGSSSQVYVSDATDTLVVNGPWTGRCAVRGGGTCRFMRCLTASDISTCVRTDNGVTEFLCPTNSFTCDVTANDGTFRVVSLAGKGVPSALGSGNQITLGQRDYKNIGCISYCGAADARCNRDITVYGYTNSTLYANHHGGRLRNETVGTCVTYDGAFTVNCRTDYPKAMPTLYLDGAGDGRIESALPARMLLFKEGTGTWTLAGANALTGGVSVLEGRLDVDGSVSAPCVVTNGAAFGGTGSVSRLTLAAGARLAFTPWRTPLAVGALTCGGAVAVDVLAAAVPGTYTLMTWTNNVAPTFTLGDAPRRTSLEVSGNALRLRVVEGRIYTLGASDAQGTTSFNTVGHWVLQSDGTTPADSPPCAGNDYVLSRMMRSPENSSVNHVVFGGDSLTLTGSGNLMWKMKTGQSMTVSDLQVNGTGLLNNGLDKSIARLRGRISIASGRTLRVGVGEPNSRGYVVESEISGGSNTTLKSEMTLTNSVVSKYKSVSYEGDNRGFLGRHLITGNGQFYVTRQENLGTPPATLRADSMTFSGATWCVTNDLTLASTNWGVTVNPFTPNADAVGVDRTLGLCFSVGASRTATLACPFFGTAPIVKDGAGTLVLSGALGGHGGGMRLADGALGFGARAASVRTLDCRGGKLLVDLMGAEPAVPRVTFTESLVATNGATLGVKLAQAALAPGESYALVRAPGTTLSTLKANSRLPCETYGGVKGVFAVASGGDGTETLTFTATNTVTESNHLPLVPRADLVADVRALGPHPRLFADAAGFQSLRDGLSTNALLRQGAEHVAAAANRLLASAPVVYKLDVSGKRLLDVSRTALFRICTLAMAYRLYGNAAHLSRAVEEMRAVCAFETWHPSHFLDVAEMSLAVAIGYDWLWEYMDAQTRAEIAVALRKYGLDASRANQGWITTANNWGQVCHAGILAAALALAEEDPVGTAAFVQRCIERLPTPMAELAPNGNYPEGPGYWTYGMEFNVVAIALLEHAFGHSYGLVDMPGFQESGAYMDLVTGPSDATFNYADGSSGRSATFARWWYAARFGRPDLLAYRELDLYRSYTALTRNGAGTNRLFPLALFWVNHEPRITNHKPRTPLVWDSQGKVPIAIQRSSWDDDKAMFVGLKGGSPSGNHGHMDGGSFILEAKRVRWALDLGSESYSPIEANPAIGNALWTMSQDSKRWWIYRLNTWSHNVPMIDGCQQWVKGSGAVTQVTSGLWGSRAVLDLSSLYTNATSVVRTGTMAADGRSYLLRDVISGVRQGGVVRWAMITKATPEIDGPRVTLRQDGKELRLEQCGEQIGVWQAQPAAGPNSWDSANSGCTQLTFTVVAPASWTVEVAVRFVASTMHLILIR